MAPLRRRFNIPEFISAEILSVRTQRGYTRKAKHVYYTAKKEASKMINAMVSYDTVYNAT